MLEFVNVSANQKTPTSFNGGALIPLCLAPPFFTFNSPALDIPLMDHINEKEPFFIYKAGASMGPSSWHPLCCAHRSLWAGPSFGKSCVIFDIWGDGSAVSLAGVYACFMDSLLTHVLSRLYTLARERSESGYGERQCACPPIQGIVLFFVAGRAVAVND